ncbi:MAG: outer membrane beta-barrel protein [Candidatus Eisenbacteria bacterium]
MNSAPRKISYRVLLVAALLAALHAAGLAAIAHAQGEAGLRFALGVPMDEFADSNEKLGPGFALHAAYAATPALAVGIGGTYMIFGSDSRKIDIPLVDDDVELNTDYNAANIYLMAQLRGRVARLTGYLEGRVGGSYLWTESKLEDDDIFDDDEVGEKVNYDDFAFCYGGGGGLMLRIVDPREADPNIAGDDGGPGVHIDMKALYVFGSEAEYLTEGDITLDEDDDPIYTVSKSRTDVLQIELGVVVSF